MTAASKSSGEVAAQWGKARRLYAVYSSMLEKFALGLPPCRDLESPIDRKEPEVLERIWKWFAQMDERIHVHQLRQLLQTSKLGTEENLRLLAQHYLDKEAKADSDRDKIDFLLVQYLASCAPPGFYDREITFEEVGQVLEPLLGETGIHPPKWAQPLEAATNNLANYRSLRDLLDPGTLERTRALKASAGDMYYGPTSLVAITRFNFLVRRTFVRLIAADLHAIRFGLHELEKAGVTHLDCSSADLSSAEPLDHLRHICHEWKKPFRAAYAASQNFKELMEIRRSVEVAVSQIGKHGADAGAQVNVPAQPEVQAPKESVEEIIAKVEKSQARRAAEHAAEQSEAEQHHPETVLPVSDSSQELDSAVRDISGQIIKLAPKENAVATISLKHIKLLLSSWEVQAFLTGHHENAEALQRTVAARAILLDALDQRKRGTGDGTRGAVKLAHAEAGRIQARIAIAKEAKDLDAAVNLAATCKRLLTLVEEAERPPKA